MKALRNIFIVLTIASITNLKAQQKDQCRYTKTPTGYLMVLRQGDDVISQIENMVKTEKIPSASFTGIGFASEVTFGFYDFNKKKFNPKTFNKVEMGSLTGSIAWNEKEPSI
ncbi:PPC domain-containing DNA-binding protein [Chryseobacterium sp. 2TAF14]|uniref:PPC domain-containing DNA-binding protein n=1 Tax=Chryseobacterium sp. 2TAF14 TaxID=3233007 RepID=UPI003F8DFCC7